MEASLSPSNCKTGENDTAFASQSNPKPIFFILPKKKQIFWTGIRFQAVNEVCDFGITACEKKGFEIFVQILNPNLAIFGCFRRLISANFNLFFSDEKRLIFYVLSRGNSEILVGVKGLVSNSPISRVYSARKMSC